ncbi:HEAT repeat domain-containing protein [Flammeovirga pectinis]|uniref:HEAT repeat domain-containing protein n=1 Tax=Flammeovirga pectinis TaxID=2494373 RepID=A0A3Q9FV31_9BACT|nr:HEAT repeat domain-containing protein [Flammeovirga pectinis]AZQ65232.1 HEAT repeat domain-containing protein [Flammeovirga pectinis]
MILEKKKLILDFICGKITQEIFEKSFPEINSQIYWEDEFNNAVKYQDTESIEYIFYLLQYIPDNFFYQMCKQLILLRWHNEHENIALSFQFFYKDPDCIDTVVQAMHLNCEHWDEEDDRDPFVRKCAYILGDLKTPYAIAKLKELSLSDDEIIKGYCTYQLKRIGEIT